MSFSTYLGNHALKSDFFNRISNCITEIPQDIKIKSIGDTVTFSAGTKLYVPNGFESDGVTKKFDTVILSDDYTNFLTDSTYPGTEKSDWIITFFTDNLGLRNTNASFIYSGDTKPTTTAKYSLWYDTKNNKFLVSEDTGATYIDKKMTLPLFIYERIGGKFNKINQVFNGFGYIGDRVFVLPGVKGISPDGRNPDGALKAKPVEITRCMLSDWYLDDNDRYLYLSNNHIGVNILTYTYFQDEEPTAQEGNVYWISERDNLIRYTNNKGQTWNKVDYILFGTIRLKNKKINYMNTYEPVNLLDRNDTRYMAHQSFPSNECTSLTLGVSGTAYKAPADGYFDLRKSATASGQWLKITGNVETCIQSSLADVLGVFNPVKKGDIVTITYTVDGTTHIFRFVYAQGSL